MNRLLHPFLKTFFDRILSLKRFTLNSSLLIPLQSLSAILLALIMFFFSCKTTSVAVKTPPAPKVEALSGILDSVKMHAFQFQWFSGKAKVEVTQAPNKTEFTANFRIKKDSAIWISISPALGIEVARMLMTRDTIRVIDRLDKKKYSRGYDFFNNYTSLPVDYYSLQNLLMGNLILDRSDYVVKMQDSVLTLVSDAKDIKDSIVLSKTWQPIQQFIEDSSASSLKAFNEQYDTQYTPPFSLLRKITVRRRDEMVIEVTFSKIKLNEPLKFPFKEE